MSWNGVKKQSIKAEIEAIETWCEEMCIQNYIINSKGEIDVNGYVNLRNKNFKELPYKFGEVNGYFTLSNNKNLTSLKNCPDQVGTWFGIDGCNKLDSLEGCPKKIRNNVFCRECKRQFTEEEVESLCEVKGDIWC